MGKETEQKQEIANQGVHTYSQEEAYVWPEEPVLRERLEWFQDQKLALMVHWGVYNQLGMVASWALSDEDAEWSRKTVDWTDDGEVFKRQYRALNRAFDPVAFQPEEWAKMAKKCGFRYLIPDHKTSRRFLSVGHSIYRIQDDGRGLSVSYT